MLRDIVMSRIDNVNGNLIRHVFKCFYNRIEIGFMSCSHSRTVFKQETLWPAFSDGTYGYGPQISLIRLPSALSPDTKGLTRDAPC